METSEPSRRNRRLNVLIVVTVAVTVLAAVGFWQRKNRLRERAILHYIKAISILCRHHSAWLPPPEELAVYRENKLRRKALAEYHFAMRDKYRRAIWRPWVERESDPPEPAQPIQIIRLTAIGPRTVTP